MTAPLVFVIPIRHPQSVPDWGLVRDHLTRTLASVCAQAGGEWECRVVANEGAELPPLPARCTLCTVDMPLPVLPDRRTARAAYYHAFRRDKGLRVHAGLRGVDPDSHVMIVDFDDFISNRLAALVTANRAAPGWFVASGYIWSGGAWCLRTNQFNGICGTSLIVRRALLGRLEEEDGSPDLTAIRRRLGSHIFLRGDLAAAGTPLAPLPFPGAVYRVGNPQSSSGTGALFQALPLRRLARQPRDLLAHLVGFRRVGPDLRAEFGLP